MSLLEKPRSPPRRATPALNLDDETDSDDERLLLGARRFPRSPPRQPTATAGGGWISKNNPSGGGSYSKNYAARMAAGGANGDAEEYLARLERLRAEHPSANGAPAPPLKAPLGVGRSKQPPSSPVTGAGWRNSSPETVPAAKPTGWAAANLGPAAGLQARTRSRSLSPKREPPAATLQAPNSARKAAAAGSEARRLAGSLFNADGGENVVVCCRFRPLNDEETRVSGRSEIVTYGADGRTVSLTDPDRRRGERFTEDGKAEQVEFAFQSVYKPATVQAELYEGVGRPLVDSVMEGYNAAVLAYGQTGSGKTYTMIGDEAQPQQPAGFGLIPRLANDIFARVKLRALEGVEDSIRCSYIEIYMEKVRDLLNPTLGGGGLEGHDLTIHEDQTRGLWVAGASEVPVFSYADVAAVLERGTAARVTAATKSNPISSRSHAIFIMAMHTLDKVAMLTKTAQLYSVDLAGAENTKISEVDGLQLEEAKKINTSLLSLSQVIFALTQGKRKGAPRFVPYRDSKLTRILQNSFGGNSRTAIVINCSPSAVSHGQTLSSLRFGDRCGRSGCDLPTENAFFTPVSIQVAEDPEQAFGERQSVSGRA
jgi:hypothetical protein